MRNSDQRYRRAGVEFRHAWLLVAGQLVAAVVVQGGDAEARLFRVSTSNSVGTLTLSAQGVLSWRQVSSGEVVRVETTYDAAAPDVWATYTDVRAESSVAQIRLFDRNTPPGFSFVPAGTYMMGSLQAGGRGGGSSEPRQVTLAHDLYVKQTEVTNREYADVLNWAKEQGYVTITPSLVHNYYGKRPLVALGGLDCPFYYDDGKLAVNVGKDEYPCMTVTWFGAMAFCNYLSDLEGLDRAVPLPTGNWVIDRDVNGYRLPTEEEWEFACRAGTTNEFASGDLIPVPRGEVDPNLDRVGWYAVNALAPANPMWNGLGSHPIGRKEPNRWGLYDMHGNVSEWCGIADPVGVFRPDDNKPCRGGSWYDGARDCRSASTYSTRPEWGDYRRGFRVVRRAASAAESR